MLHEEIGLPETEENKDLSFCFGNYNGTPRFEEALVT